MSVTQTRDGVWSVNRVAKAKRSCRVAVLEEGGAVKLAHDYLQEAT